MFEIVYSFLYDWLFANGIGSLTLQGAELVTILFSLVVIGLGIFIICMPFIYLFRLIIR